MGTEKTGIYTGEFVIGRPIAYTEFVIEGNKDIGGEGDVF